MFCLRCVTREDEVSSFHLLVVTAKDLVVFLGCNVTIVQGGNDCAVRERELSFAISLDRDVVAQNGSKTVKVAFFMGHGDQAPVAVSGGNFGDEGRRGLLSHGLSRCPRREGNNASQSCNCDQQGSESFHRDASGRPRLCDPISQEVPVMPRRVLSAVVSARRFSGTTRDIIAMPGSGRRCVASENIVAIFCRRVAGEALCV
jgi:hypothetical protein